MLQVKNIEQITKYWYYYDFYFAIENYITFYLASNNMSKK